MSHALQSSRSPQGASHLEGWEGFLKQEHPTEYEEWMKAPREYRQLRLEVTEWLVTLSREEHDFLRSWSAWPGRLRNDILKQWEYEDSLPLQQRGAAESRYFLSRSPLVLKKRIDTHSIAFGLLTEEGHPGLAEWYAKRAFGEDVDLARLESYAEAAVRKDYREVDYFARNIRDFWGLKTALPVASDPIVGLRELAEWTDKAVAEIREVWAKELATENQRRSGKRKKFSPGEADKIVLEILMKNEAKDEKDKYLTARGVATRSEGLISASSVVSTKTWKQYAALIGRRRERTGKAGVPTAVRLTDGLNKILGEVDESFNEIDDQEQVDQALRRLLAQAKASKKEVERMMAYPPEKRKQTAELLKAQHDDKSLDDMDHPKFRPRRKA